MSRRRSRQGFAGGGRRDVRRQGGEDEYGAGQAGGRVDHEQPAQVDGAHRRGDQPRGHAGHRQRRSEQPEGHRPQPRRGQVGDERLARWLVELEGEAERDGGDGGRGQAGRGGERQLGEGAAEEAEGDGGTPPEPVGQHAPGQPRRDAGDPEGRHDQSRGGQPGVVHLHQEHRQERQAERAEPVDRPGRDEDQDRPRQPGPAERVTGQFANVSHRW